MSRELTKRAVDSAIQSDRRETGAIWEAIGAQREAAFGNFAGARRSAARSLKLAPTSQGVQVEAALALVLAGYATRAESFAQELERRYPLDSQMQSLWLPAIQAQLALGRKDTPSALQALQVVRPPFEYGVITFTANATG